MITIDIKLKGFTFKLNTLVVKILSKSFKLLIENIEKFKTIDYYFHQKKTFVKLKQQIPKYIGKVLSEG